MNNFTKRAEVIQKANELIAHASTREERLQIAGIVENLLVAADSYQGYNYKYWIERGFKEWQEAGRPQDNKEYLGDQSVVVFY